MALLLAGCAAAGACTEGPENRAWPPAGHRPQSEDLEALRALGYVDYAGTVADLSKNGARTLVPSAVSPGYRLYGLNRSCRANLIDATGRVVRTWHLDGCNKWMATELMPTGDLLVVGHEAEGSQQVVPEYVARLSWQGALLWKKHMRAHHYVAADGDGFAVLTLKHRRVPGYGAPILDDHLTFLSEAGEVRREVSIYDMVERRRIDFALQPVADRDGHHDLFHCNTFERMHNDSLARRHGLYGAQNVVVTCRHQDSVFIFDLVREELVWAWGQGVLDGPHDASVLDNGNLLVFDNGLQRRWSRVLELDPVTRRIVWEYPAHDGAPFYSRSRGSSQRLPNGNTLVCNSNSGQAVEITTSGEPVWEFNNPLTNHKGHRAIILRMKRYDSASVQTLLARQNRGRGDGGQRH